MKKKNYNIAAYIDMENIATSDFQLEEVMNSLLRADDEYNCILTIKLAYGNQATAKKSLKTQILDSGRTKGKSKQ
ncbi:hypothetical protein JCM19232_4504 [Vibrio ishigakensis]|uniref:Uncharacterized protein n=1 Tax=Vibrio ishigakensis TaxID=1481914 RepID=A0A0B8PDY2_9VIBR|nr:hypothetical protein JCM19232_4504 [Vibrio ishigakensis]